jgi:ABC exporter DevB family membrane fusion protein
MTKKRAIILLIGLLAIMGLGIAMRSRSGLFSRIVQLTDAMETVKSKPDVGETITLACTGRIEGDSEAISVGAGIDGVIAELRVKEGQQVAAGAVIAIIERHELRAALSEAGAAVERAKAVRERLLTGSRREERERADADIEATEAVVKQAQARYERYQKLYQEGVLSADARDEAFRNLAVAQANLKATKKAQEFVNVEPLPEELARADAEIRAAEERVRVINEQIKKCVVRAPIAGTVLRTNMKVGETYSTFTPQPIVTLADTANFKVRAEVDERDIDKIALRQRVLIQGDAFKDRRVFGVVSRISSQMGRKKVRTGDPAEKSDRDVLEVLIDIEGIDKALVVGLRVTIQFLQI